MVRSHMLGETRSNMTTSPPKPPPITARRSGPCTLVRIGPTFLNLRPLGLDPIRAATSLTQGGIGRVCVVADRGMISAATIAALEERGLEYVLGARERTDTLVRTVVLADKKPFTPLCVERANGEQTQLFAKEVKVDGRRYIVCRNEAEAAKDAADRQAIVAALDQQLKRGDKALIGNSAYRRYLRTTSDRRAFEIDPGKLADEARYDGIFVLRTNARLPPLQALLRYRDLIQVEQLFRS